MKVAPESPALSSSAASSAAFAAASSAALAAASSRFGGRLERRLRLGGLGGRLAGALLLELLAGRHCLAHRLLRARGVRVGLGLLGGERAARLVELVGRGDELPDGGVVALGDSVQVADIGDDLVEVLAGEKQLDQAARALLHLVLGADGFGRRLLLRGQLRLDLGHELLVRLDLFLQLLNAPLGFVVARGALHDPLLKLVEGIRAGDLRDAEPRRGSDHGQGKGQRQQALGRDLLCVNQASGLRVRGPGKPPGVRSCR